MFAHSKSALMALFATLVFSSMGFAQVEDLTSKLKSTDAATRKGAWGQPPVPLSLNLSPL